MDVHNKDQSSIQQRKFSVPNISYSKVSQFLFTFIYMTNFWPRHKNIKVTTKGRLKHTNKQKTATKNKKTINHNKEMNYVCE